MLPIPHLMIVIDEFAELKKEQPEFMRELISVAQVGRSLGIHLILATQKPSGTVDDNIWSNARFKLCLRVQDRKDSQEMLHKSDAAYLTQAGRCYLQVGNDEVYELFQSGWSGAIYDEDQTAQGDIAKLLTMNGKAALVGSYVKNQKRDQNAMQNQRTQLEAVRSYLAKVARREGYICDQKLWLPVLPEELYLEDLPELSESKEYTLQTEIGLYDDPKNQKQGAMCIDLAKDGNYMVVGSVVSGKSTLLHTYLYSLMRRYEPADISLYLLDYSSKLLATLSDAPHVGGVVLEDEVEKCERFFVMLQRQLTQRKKLFGSRNYSQYIRANDRTLPAIVIAIDNLSGFMTKTDAKYDELLTTILKEGVNYGIYVIASVTGLRVSEVPLHMSECFRNVICLAQPAKHDYQDALRTMQLDVLPETGVRGRGIAKIGESILEFQTALPVRAEEEYLRTEEVRKLCLKMNDSYGGKRVKVIPTIPENPTWKTFDKDAGWMFSDVRYLPVGYDRADAEVYGIDLMHTHRYLVSGRSGSGKTNFLRTVIMSASRKTGEVAVIDCTGELEYTAHATPSAEYIHNVEGIFSYFNALAVELRERNQRKKDGMARGLSSEELFAEMQNFKPIYIVIDDLPAFIQVLKNAGKGYETLMPFVQKVLENGAQCNIFWFAAYEYDSVRKLASNEVYREFIKEHVGIHFGGIPADQQIMSFDYVGYDNKSKPLAPGVGMLSSHDWDDTRYVVVPLYRAE